MFVIPRGIHSLCIHDVDQLAVVDGRRLVRSVREPESFLVLFYPYNAVLKAEVVQISSLVLAVEHIGQHEHLTECPEQFGV